MKMYLGCLAVGLSIASEASPVRDWVPVRDAEMQAAHALQCGQQGFASPANYSIELVQLGRREAKTERRGESTITFIDSRIDSSLWPSYIHHEFSHAVQIRLGGPSKSLFMDEASATLQEMLAFPNSGAWQKSVAEFQSQPNIAPLIDTETRFDYGGALFLFFLEKHFCLGDGQLTRRLWERASPVLPAVGAGQWMSIIESETRQDFSDTILTFASWRTEYPGLRTHIVSSPSVREVFLTEDDWPTPLGCVIVEIPPMEVKSVHLRARSQSPLAIGFERSYEKTFAVGQSRLYVPVCDCDKNAFILGDYNPRPLRILLDFS